MANQEHLKVVIAAAEAITEWRAKNPGVRLDLHGASLERRELRGANLSEADLGQAHLEQAHLQGADLSGSDLRHADVKLADLAGANITEAQMLGANLTAAGLAGIRGARTVGDLSRTIGDDRFDRPFAQCEREWPERWFSWERLRAMGRLPLFGVSYTALVILPVFYYGLDFYNQTVGKLRTWAHQHLADDRVGGLAAMVNAALAPIAIPLRSLEILVSVVLLAIRIDDLRGLVSE